MNNFKKIGVSALAASLTAVSAQAVEMSVSGYWELTHTSMHGSAAAGTNQTADLAGNSFGSKSAMEFSGSGDVNGMTAAVYSAINDNNPAGYLSHMITLDMGDMGMVGFDQGVGKFGFSTIDDKSPTAYEESWHGTSFSSGGLGATGGSASVLGYKNTFAGVNLSAEFSPSFNDTTDNGDGGNSGAGSQGSNMNFALTTSALVDGLSMGFGMGENDDNRVIDGTSQSQSSAGAFVNYSMGPVTVGVTSTYTSGDIAATAANAVEAYGIAFNVNENLSISFNEHSNEFKKTASAATGGSVGRTDVTQKSTGIAAAYTMGAAAIRIQNNDVDNVAGVTGTNEEITEISLFLSF